MQTLARALAVSGHEIFHQPEAIDKVSTEVVVSLSSLAEPEMQRKLVKLNSLSFRGRLVQGKGEAAGFTQLDWVVNQFKEKFGFTPYPGTANLKVTAKEFQVLRELAVERGVSIVPPTPQFCEAKCIKVRVAEIEGVLVFPLVQHYYGDVVEIVAPVSFKETLKWEPGDWVTVAVVNDRSSATRGPK